MIQILCGRFWSKLRASSTKPQQEVQSKIELLVLGFNLDLVWIKTVVLQLLVEVFH